MKKTRTHKDYAALEEKFMQTAPDVDFSKPGVFARQRMILDYLDNVSAVYIQSRAEAESLTPAQVINTLIREKISLSA